MLKMLLDPMGGIVITNDGHCILREVDVSHPAAKSMIELSRAQDEEVGDGTTSVIILGESVCPSRFPRLHCGGWTSSKQDRLQKLMPSLASLALALKPPISLFM